MRTILIAFITTVLLTGCRSVGTKSVSQLPGNSPVPRAVVRLAEAYMDSLADRRTQDRAAMRQAFSENFFEGFTRPGAPMPPNFSAAGEEGLDAGRRHRLLPNRNHIKETMEGYGYITIKAEGTWIGRHFESISFHPSSQPTQRWGLSYLGDAKGNANPLALLDITEMPNEGVRVRIEGYLSPRVIFPDPIGGCDYEFFATSISKINGGSVSDLAR